MKKILIVTAAFYPENSPRSFRATELAKELSRQGNDVTVLTIPRDERQNEFCVKNHIILKETKKPVFKDFTVKQGVGSLVKRYLRRLLLMLFEYPDIELAFRFGKALQEEKEYDLLISIAAPFPVHWGVAWARSVKHKIANVCIADCGDPYMGNESDSFKRLFYFAALEKWSFRKFDKIAIPIESARSAYYKEFHSKIHVIPQGLNFDELSAHRIPYKENSIISFAYAGTFIPGKRDPLNLMNFLSTIKSDFRFYVFTSTKFILSDFEDKLGNRLIILPYVSRPELIKKLSQMDFLINIDNSTSTQAPSKLIDYFICGRPILSVHSTQKDFLSLLAFLERNYSDRLSLTNFEQYKIENVVLDFMHLAVNKNG